MVLRGPGLGEEHAPAGFIRRRQVALGGAAVVAVVAAGLWVERRPIAERLIDRELAARGVPARYVVADLGPGRQRLTGVVIGDPRAPDLVADWIETQTSIGLTGARLTGVRVGRVRVRGRIVDERLSLGALDRLLPKGAGGRATLPALSVAVADARLSLTTPAGPVAVQVAGTGRLDRDFRGRVVLGAPALAVAGCSIAAPHAALRIATGDDAIRLTGPATAAAARCARARATSLSGDVDVILPADASRWRGTLQLAAVALDHPQVRARSLAGSARFAGDARATTGTLALQAQRIASTPLRAARGSLTGTFAIGATQRLDAGLAVSGGAIDPAALAVLRRGAASAAGTPLGPLAQQAVQTLGRAAQAFGGTAQLALAADANGAHATLTRAVLIATSGATARFAGEVPLIDRKPAHGAVALSGGGLPTLDLGLSAGKSGAIDGALVAAPYAGGGARLALAPVAFAWLPGGSLRLTTTATLSGPLAGGRVEGLSLPIAARVDAHGAMTLDERCTPVGFQRLALGTLDLAAARLTLCPTGGALVRVAGGRVSGGASTGALHLTGRLGDSPLDLAASGVRAPIGGALLVDGLAARLGQADRATRFTAARVEARAAGGAIGGSVTGLDGQIGAVPLLLADGAGNWRFAGGVFDLRGALTVLDAAAARPRDCAVAGAAGPRFCPMLAQGVALRIGDGHIGATGTLAEPSTGTRVATVAIDHDLAAGAGHADLRIDRLSFGKTFQPDLLTPITTGVVADVAGTIDGSARIGWDAGGGVTSTGRFATAGTDLAAAFGPVTGIAGSIAFTDLLSLTSAPGQELTVRSINPGIAVENGVVRFHTEPGVKVAVESARWPFAGGTLTLDPTLLDFAAPAERHLTFRLAGVAADQFLQQFDFKNLAATGTFDGVLPMVFDAAGGRIEGGRLAVRQDGEGAGGTLAYVGDVSEKDIGVWGNLAFQALKSLRYRSLTIAMNGPLDGEMVTEVRFAGISQGAGAKSNFLIRRLQRLPFVFNVRIKAPFRTLLDGLDPAKQAQINTPRLIQLERQAAATRSAVQGSTVQQGASEAVP